VSVTRVAYTAEGWGEGELWLDGPRLVWHELPRPCPRTPTQSKGGAEHPPPSRSTISGRRAQGTGRTGPEAQQLVHTLQRYFKGARVRFEDVELDLGGLTTFQREVADTLRRVPWGEVVSYGELARLAGYPNAQRAAGTFCAHNRFPLILPCHRVVAANGLGSYGSLGAAYKRRLLELEGVTL
jgi:methylated-DNA-[protein]-cysteine S-methyltransferase